ncbi:MAG TPA: GNAT family N-acetyltransferase [Acidimicrobiales bacterium]|nr:GNAT family N-acetyltransferase [Acidimicrobiales bacterium]
MASLREMTPDEVTNLLPRIMDGYVEERVGAGQDVESARATANEQHAILFPDGRAAEGQHLMHVLDGDNVVGLLWMGRPMSAIASTWFVYYVEVNPDQRGRGYGRAAMELAESWTREHGGTRVALNVFGPNLVARSLYDALGYEVMATTMFKEVGD